MPSRVLHPLKRFFFRSTGYSYPNMGRLFLRLFVGIMFIQFGLHQIAHFEQAKEVFPAVLGMDSEWSLIAMITIEIICSLCIMFGFLTRIMTVPPFIAMLVAEIYIQSADAVNHMSQLTPWQQQNYLPVMFMGIFFFLFMVGPGKISADYFLSLRMIEEDERDEDEELEVI